MGGAKFELLRLWVMTEPERRDMWVVGRVGDGRELLERLTNSVRVKEVLPANSQALTWEANISVLGSSSSVVGVTD